MQVLGYEDIRGMLGVSHPLLMLDRLALDVGQGRAEGVKCVSSEEVQFAGHFPGQPVMPGVLQLAAMVQASSALFLSEGLCGKGFAPVAVAFSRVKFRRPVRPGMRLTVSCVRGGGGSDGGVEYAAKLSCGGQVVSSGNVRVAAKSLDWFAPWGGVGVEVGAMPPLDAVSVESRLPHRYPFLFLDGIESIEDMSDLCGVKNVTGSGVYTHASQVAHFPNLLQIESAAQLGCAAALSRPENRGCYGFFMSIDRAVCHGPGLPGDRLDVRLGCDMFGHSGVATGSVSANGRLLTELTIKFALVEGAAKEE